MNGGRNTRKKKIGRSDMQRTGKRESHDLIRENLRRVYGEVTEEPLPPSLVDLLKELGDSENGS